MNDISAALIAFEYNSFQSSWDYPADLAFALHAERIPASTIDLLRAIVGGGNNGIFAVRAHDAYVKKSVTARRLRALRKLVRARAVRCSWSGTGPGGVSELGVGRARVYEILVPYYRVDCLHEDEIEFVFAGLQAKDAYKLSNWTMKHLGNRANPFGKRVFIEYLHPSGDRRRETYIPKLVVGSSSSDTTVSSAGGIWWSDEKIGITVCLERYNGL